MRHFLRGNDEEEMDVPINLRFDYGDLTERLNAIEALNAPFFNRVSAQTCQAGHRNLRSIEIWEPRNSCW